jgi:hypothetical protein
MRATVMRAAFHDLDQGQTPQELAGFGRVLIGMLVRMIREDPP